MIFQLLQTSGNWLVMAAGWGTSCCDWPELTEAMDGMMGQLGAAVNDASQFATDKTIYCDMGHTLIHNKYKYSKYHLKITTFIL